MYNFQIDLSNETQKEVLACIQKYERAIKEGTIYEEKLNKSSWSQNERTSICQKMFYCANLTKYETTLFCKAEKEALDLLNEGAYPRFLDSFF